MYADATLPIPAAPPRRALRPQKGGRLAAGPQSRIHRNGPFRKTARKRPRAFGGVGPAHCCPSTGLGGACGCQSRAESGVASKPPAQKKKKKEKIFWTRSALIKCDVLKLGVKIEAKIYLDVGIFLSLNRLSCMLCCIH